ncbi:MAG: glycine cleavage system protein GcvH [Thermodesulfobacteriota bacterium]
MNLPEELKYGKQHEWAKVEGNQVTVGITDFAQSELGEVVYIELPAKGTSVQKDKPFGIIESVKAVSDLYSPVSGKVAEVNGGLEESPEIVNDDPYGEGWMIKIIPSDISELDTLLSAKEYEEFLKEEK